MQRSTASRDRLEPVPAYSDLEILIKQQKTNEIFQGQNQLVCKSSSDTVHAIKFLETDVLTQDCRSHGKRTITIVAT